MKKKLRVLSLFDGMSCGRIALERAGFDVEVYYACEIKEHAMAVSNKNYPDIIQLGDVTKLDTSKLGKIDLLIGGSPCQGFSMAGKRKGSSTTDGVIVDTLDKYIKLKFDGFEFDGQSYLFWEYIRRIETC